MPPPRPSHGKEESTANDRRREFEQEIDVAARSASPRSNVSRRSYRASIIVKTTSNDSLAPFCSARFDFFPFFLFVHRPRRTSLSPDLDPVASQRSARFRQGSNLFRETMKHFASFLRFSLPPLFARRVPIPSRLPRSSTVSRSDPFDGDASHLSSDGVVGHGSS